MTGPPSWTWLTVFQLPACAPDLHSQEGIWSLVKRDIGNLAAAGLSQITRSVKHRLKQIQYRPELVDSCLTGTGLVMDSRPTSHISHSAARTCCGPALRWTHGLPVTCCGSMRRPWRQPRR
ncbi:hypothetical protein GCM10018966_076210 [Streptomyces yanii]